MCSIVQRMCLKPLLAVSVIHCWSSGFLTTSYSPRSPKWLVGTHCTSTGWTTNSVLGVDVNMGEWGWECGGHQHRWVGWEWGGHQHGWVGWEWGGHQHRWVGWECMSTLNVTCEIVVLATPLQIQRQQLTMHTNTPRSLLFLVKEYLSVL